MMYKTGGICKKRSEVGDAYVSQQLSQTDRQTDRALSFMFDLKQL